MPFFHREFSPIRVTAPNFHELRPLLAREWADKKLVGSLTSSGFIINRRNFMLTAKQIQEFKLLYEKRFGEQLNDEQATLKATKLLRILELVYRPLTKEEFQRFSGQEGGNMDG